MGKNIKGIIIKFIIGILIIAGIWYLVKCQCINLASFTPSAIRDYIQGFGNMAAVVFIIAYILNTISIIPPIAPLSLTAGLAFGSLWGAVFLMAGALIGTSITFFISRFFGRGIVDKVLKGKFKNAEERLEKNGFFAILFFRIIPIPPFLYETLNYLPGLTKIRFKDYFLATFFGLIPGVVISAFFGGSLGDIKAIKDLLAPKFLIAVGLMIFMLVVPTIYQIIKRKKEQQK